MRILLADDTDKIRFALRVLLERQPGIRVTGEAVDVDELLALAKAICPDLVLLDWDLPGLDPPLTLIKLRLCCPETRVIALSGRQDVQARALAAGADAFISKATSPDHLLNAIVSYQHPPNPIAKEAAR